MSKKEILALVEQDWSPQQITGRLKRENKLIRQYTPQKATFNDFNEQQIKQIQFKINN
ncbi:MAG: hypothetical protein LBT29_05055 [Flavobacteriaceae bacterium]|jgi:IS30 family transposase|nr:hypothetical protein [Flavobacteriaceae bacterium]